MVWLMRFMVNPEHFNRPVIGMMQFVLLYAGCQRMAIGRKTLEKLAEQLPPGLSVCTKKQEHRFKSVHGRSNTQFVACVPTSIGKKGSYFMPAVFDNPESAAEAESFSGQRRILRQASKALEEMTVCGMGL